MFRIDNSSAVDVLPTPLALGVPGFFGRGNPAIGLRPTIISADWANWVQEEPIAVVEAAGLALDKTSHTQLLQALNILFATRSMFIGMSFEFNGSTLPSGFLWEDGANVSRTTYSALFARIGTTFGAGNGMTTFGLPDSRGRVAVGKDNMGGTAASRVTSGVSGLAGSTLGAVGGDERMHGHTHSVSDSGHNHGVNDPWHAHGVGDPGHNHYVNDPGHAHSSNTRWTDTGTADGGTPHWAGDNWATTTGSGTGIWLNPSATGVYVAGGGTGIYLSASGTGISIVAAGAGATQNVQPSIVKNKIIYAGV